MATPTYTKAGAKATTAVKLDASVFAVMPTNYELIKLAYNAYLANGRENLAITKTRGLVSGGGKKPWRQKGTGRARIGSSRAPHWRHGGITFGPTGEENYTLRVPVSMKRLALRQALSVAADAGKIRVIESLEAKDGKASKMAEMLVKIDVKGRALIVTTDKSDTLMRATRNLPEVTVVGAKYLNVFDIMNADSIIIDEAALKTVSAWLGSETKGAKK